jgi:hypothetical protein
MLVFHVRVSRSAGESELRTSSASARRRSSRPEKPSALVARTIVASLVSSFDASAAEDLLSIFPKEPRDARRSAGLIRWKCAAILASNVGDAITRPR